VTTAVEYGNHTTTIPNTTHNITDTSPKENCNW